MDDQPLEGVATSKEGCGTIGRLREGPFVKCYEGGERSQDSECRSDGGSSGGAKNEGKAGNCDFVDEYASVFDFL